MAGLVLSLIFFTGIAAVFGLTWYFSPDQRAKRILRATNVVRIRDAIEGQTVRITGRVRYVATPLVAPLTRRPCAGFRVEVEERRGSGKSRHWHRIILDEEVGDLELDDGTGRALVRGHGATVVVVRDAHYSSGTFNDATPNLEAFLSRHNQESSGFLGINKTMRYKEGVLEEGELVTALGIARWEHDPSPARADERGYREVPRRLVIDATDEGKLILSDDPSALH